MTMVNTFMKTQHQHVMPQRERKGKRSKQSPGLTLASEGERGQGEGRRRSPGTAHPSRPPGASPRSPPPAPARGRKTHHHGRERPWSVKTLAGGPSSWKEPPPTPGRRTMPVSFPMHMYTLDSELAHTK